MGQGLSCASSHEHGLFTAVQHGDLATVRNLLHRDPTLLHHTTVYDRHSALHIAAANGQIEVSFNFFVSLANQFNLRGHFVFNRWISGIRPLIGVILAFSWCFVLTDFLAFGRVADSIYAVRGIC